MLPGTVIKNPTNGQPFTGNIIPQGLLDPTGLKVASYYPAPNAPGNRLNVSPTGHNTDQVAVAKGDIVISQNNRLSIRSAFEDDTYVYPIAVYSASTNIPGFGLNQPGAHNYTEGINDTHLFSPSLIGVFAIGWNRFEFEYFGETSASQSGGKDYCTILGIQGCRTNPRDYAWPSFSLNSVYANLGGSTTQFGPFDTFFLNPSMTWVKGKHTVKFGMDFHRFTSDYEIGWGSGAHSPTGVRGVVILWLTCYWVIRTRSPRRCIRTTTTNSCSLRRSGADLLRTSTISLPI